MKSSLKNMVLCLGLTTLVAAVGLSYVYGLTKEPIEKAKQQKTTDALGRVLPAFEGEPAVSELTLDGMPIKVYAATSGYAVETMTKSGFSGEVRLMVGFLPDGEVHNIEVLQQNETPGLGSKMAEEGNPLVLSFRGRKPAEMKMAVRKDGGEVDAITASTISSRAYIDAVERAHRAFIEVAGVAPAEPVEANTGATTIEQDSTQHGGFETRRENKMGGENE
jgi:electron transport complex protein RnfG